ncbi:MAG: 50S ribosomal protein L4 [Spirochaetaceae bacterium]|nr:50S ribosomal protein L4 [Myxococcales bacterium]MCB9723723.1 50S ribosomal protein L4 [Spirochaetaceae bacterium]HPG25064.1 50S ribosomal protein L4 [Myxococcota bacterium]
MATIDVVNLENKKAGSVDLSSAVFEAEVRPHLYHAEVRRQLADRRAGTHSTRNRALVSGGGAKPYRQKGTGRARQGSIRAPQYAGGGIVFGPVPRGYSHKLPKKVRAAALRSALTERLSASAMTVVDDLQLDGYKTKRMVEILGALGLSGTTLIVIDEANPMVEVSARNLPGVSVVRAEGLNVYDLLRHGHLLITKAALAQVEKRLAGAGSEGASR